jgi:hypothetical protein
MMVIIVAQGWFPLRAITRSLSSDYHDNCNNCMPSFYIYLLMVGSGRGERLWKAAKAPYLDCDHTGESLPNPIIYIRHVLIMRPRLIAQSIHF